MVLGGGPGGYTAAFRAADLGRQVVLVERYPVLGGVCLNVGCIPSKALLHAAKIIQEAQEASNFGLNFGTPSIDLEKLREWKDKVVKTLTTGLAGLAKQRKVTVVNGVGRFSSDRSLTVETAEGPRTIEFDHAIIAAGSQPVRIPGFPHDDPRMMDSTDALELAEVPKRLLIIGGGIIGARDGNGLSRAGLEDHIGRTDGSDHSGLRCGFSQTFISAHQETVRKHLPENQSHAHQAKSEGLQAYFEGDEGAPESDLFDRVLVAVGRKPNGHLIGAEMPASRWMRRASFR